MFKILLFVFLAIVSLAAAMPALEAEDAREGRVIFNGYGLYGYRTNLGYFHGGRKFITSAYPYAREGRLLLPGSRIYNTPLHGGVMLRSWDAREGRDYVGGGGNGGGGVRG